jgi:polar amino acid transport system permease protein
VTDTPTAAGRSRGDADERDVIEAVPLRRPGRSVSAAVIVVLLGLFIYGAATNDAYQWHVYGKYIFDKRISQASLITIDLTVISMIAGVIIGVLVAVMRLSQNPVLRAAGWAYLWLFRGTPVYVQLVFWGLVTSIYKQVDLGVPFVHQFAHINTQTAFTLFEFAAIGLALNEGAYMAEVVRAGINSVGEGQTEAATALGMSWPQTMRRIVLPQAMRVIIPPTGNEVISMLKTTSLVVAVPYTYDLYSRANDIGNTTYAPIPLLLVASTWYLAITSVLMVGQYFLEQRFARGSSRTLSPRQLRALAKAQADAHGAGAR